MPGMSDGDLSTGAVNSAGCLVTICPDPRRTGRIGLADRGAMLGSPSTRSRSTPTPATCFTTFGGSRASAVMPTSPRAAPANPTARYRPISRCNPVRRAEQRPAAAVCHRDRGVLSLVPVALYRRAMAARERPEQLRDNGAGAWTHDWPTIRPSGQLGDHPAPPQAQRVRYVRHWLGDLRRGWSYRHVSRCQSGPSSFRLNSSRPSRRA